MNKTKDKPQMAVIVFRALSFLRHGDEFKATVDDKGVKTCETVNTAEDGIWFHLQPKRTPQEVPDWVLETDTYRAALEARYLIEVPVTASFREGPLAFVGADQIEERFPTLAAGQRAYRAPKPRTHRSCSLNLR